VERWKRAEVVNLYGVEPSALLTCNKAFADWSHVFAGDAIMASAALDRLLHRSTVINIRGDSYRLREKRQANALLPKEAPTQPMI
jgi:DNA replication protein DnaC